MKTWTLLLAVMAAAFVLVGIPSGATAQTPAPATANFEQRVGVEVLRSRSNRVGGGDYDDKTDRISFTVKLTNSDPKASFENFTAEFYVWAQSILNKKAYLLLTVDQSPVSLPPRGVHEFVSKEGATKYDTTGVRFGAKYDGWVLVIRDSTGNIVLKKSTQPAWLPVADSLKTVTPGNYYDRDLKPAIAR